MLMETILNLAVIQANCKWKLWKGIIRPQGIHWDYVENTGKIKMVQEWKKIVTNILYSYVLKKIFKI